MKKYVTEFITESAVVLPFPNEIISRSRFSGEDEWTLTRCSSR